MKKIITIALLFLITVGFCVSCNADAVEKVFDTSYKVQPDGSWKMGNKVYEPSTKPYILVLPKTVDLSKDVQLADLEANLIPLDDFALNVPVAFETAQITLSKDKGGILFYSYENNTDEAQAQNIYMKTHDDYSETILLDAPEDEFSHYGSLNVATVGSVAQKSYYEYGYVKRIILKIGHLVVKSQADVDQIIVDADADAKKVSIDVESDKVEEVIIPEEKKDEILKNSRIPEPIVKTPSYLCFTAEEANSSVKLIKTGTPFDISLETSIDGGKTWTSYTVDTEIPLSNAGDKVYFKTKNNNANFSKDYSNYYKFELTNKVSCSGNIMYLLDANGITTTVPEYSFVYLFNGCASLISVPDLPATTLGKACYSCMFQGCTGLTSIPEGLLPAMKMEEYCYYCMFYNCSGLTSIPADLLPATELAQECYYSMFAQCSGLTSIPEGLLPATELAKGCYNSMFDVCTGLTSVPEGLLPATELAEECYYEMFSDCSSLTTAPVLPATVLATKSYYQMFSGCTALNSVSVQFTDWKTDINATSYWLNGTSSAGTFTCTAGLDTSTRDDSHIPSDWTVVAPCKVTFDMQNHGTQIAEISNIEYGTTITKPTNPTSDGCIFKGWYKESTFENEWNFDTDTVTTNTTLYAKWAETVGYFINSDSFPAKADTNWSNENDSICYFYAHPIMQTMNCIYFENGANTSLVMLYEELTKTATGYSFRDNSAGFTVTFNMDGDSLISIKLDADEAATDSIKAIAGTYKPKYTISFDMNGHGTQIAAVKIESGNKITRPTFTDPAPEGYAFAGWYKESTCTNAWNFDNDTVTGNTTLYAKWNEKPFVFVSGEANASVKLVKNGSPNDISLEYSTDGANFQDYTFTGNDGKTIALANVGDKVFFKAKDSNTNFSTDTNNYYQFVLSNRLSCNGNIMYLLDSTGKKTSVPAYAFYKLFSSCSTLTSAPLLPATSLASNSYGKMFSGCSNLDSVTMLATSFYANSISDWLENTAATGTLMVAGSMKDSLDNDTYRPSGWTVVSPISYTKQVVTLNGQADKTFTITLYSSYSGYSITSISKDGSVVTSVSNSGLVITYTVGSSSSERTGYITVTIEKGTDSYTEKISVYQQKPTLKAVYDVTNGDNILTFYYDYDDHRGTNKTVYTNIPVSAAGESSWPYNNVRENIKKVIIDSSVLGYSGLKSTKSMFENMTNAAEITGAEYLNVSNVSSMENMFCNFGSKLTTLTSVPNVSNWDVSEVVDMSKMFESYGAASTSLHAVPNVSNWKCSNVGDLDYMFKNYGAASTSLNVVPDVKGKWVTSSCKNMNSMFASYGAASTVLNTVPDVSAWDTSEVTSMDSMFMSYGKNSKSLNAVPDVSGWSTENCTNIKQMFASYGAASTALTAVPNISKWKTSNVEHMKEMFKGYGETSENLNFVLDFSDWNVSKISDGGNNSVFDSAGLRAKTWTVWISAKTGEKDNTGSEWYVGDGRNSIVPLGGKSFTLNKKTLGTLFEKYAADFPTSAATAWKTQDGNNYGCYIESSNLNVVYNSGTKQLSLETAYVNGIPEQGSIVYQFVFETKDGVVSLYVSDNSLVKIFAVVDGQGYEYIPPITYTITFATSEHGAVYDAATSGQKVTSISAVDGATITVTGNKITIGDKDYYAVADSGYKFKEFSGTVPATITEATTITPVFEEATPTFKAVYDTTGEVNKLTFYYDLVDHSGDDITVYDNLPNKAIYQNDWPYHGVRESIKEVVIDSSVADYSGLESTTWMFANMKNATSISGAESLEVSNVSTMSHMFYMFGADLTTMNSVPDVR